MTQKQVDLYAKGFKMGWEACRSHMCKIYNLNEKDVIENENKEW